MLVEETLHNYQILHYTCTIPNDPYVTVCVLTVLWCAYSHTTDSLDAYRDLLIRHWDVSPRAPSLKPVLRAKYDVS